MTVDDLDGLISRGGFAKEVCADEVVVIPSGMLLIMVSGAGNTSYRWAVSSDDADSARVLHMCRQVLAAFPEHRGQGIGLTQWVDFLESRAASA